MNKKNLMKNKSKLKNEKKNLSLRIIYNDKSLGLLKKKEIANLRKRIKEINEKYRTEEKEIENLKARDFK